MPFKNGRGTFRWRDGSNAEKDDPMAQQRIADHSQRFGRLFGDLSERNGSLF
jgi:hypothetical protein